MPQSKVKKTDVPSSPISVSSSSPTGDNEVIEISSDDSVPSNPIISKGLTNKKAIKDVKTPQATKRHASETFDGSSKKARDSTRGSPKWDIESAADSQRRSSSPEDAAPVTISNETGRRIFMNTRAKSPTFGDFPAGSKEVKHQASGEGEPATSPERKTKRQPVPTEKARYMREEASNSADTVRGTPSKKSAIGKGAAQQEQRTPTQRGKAQAEQVRVKEEPLSPAMTEQTPSKKSKKSAREDTIDEANESGLMERPSSKHASVAALSKKAQMKTKEIDRGDEEEKAQKVEQDANEDASQSPQSFIPRPLPRPRAPNGFPAAPEQHYDPCVLESFGYMAREGRIMPIVGKLMISAAYKHLKGNHNNPYGAKNLLRCYGFTSANGVHNPARADALHMAVIKDSTGNGRIVARGVVQSMATPSTIFLTSGCVHECNLIYPGTSRVGSKNDVKKISIWVMSEELDPMIAYFGEVFGRRRLWGPFYQQVLTFSGQQLTDAAKAPPRQTTPSAQSSPRKQPAGLFGPPSSSTSFSPTTYYAGGGSHTHFLRFADDVPVYDIRNVKFTVTEESINNISKLPRYGHGISDLKSYAIVTVGYTVNTYQYNYKVNSTSMEEKSSALSLNVQFVLFHGDPKRPEEEDGRDGEEGEEGDCGDGRGDGRGDGSGGRVKEKKKKEGKNDDDDDEEDEAEEKEEEEDE